MEVLEGKLERAGRGKDERALRRSGERHSGREGEWEKHQTKIHIAWWNGLAGSSTERSHEIECQPVRKEDLIQKRNLRERESKGKERRRNAKIIIRREGRLISFLKKINQC